MKQIINFYRPLLFIKKAPEIQAGKVTCGIIKEHVLRTGVTGIDTAAFRTGVPVIDRCIELQAGIGALPGTHHDLIPKVTGSDRACMSACCPLFQLPQFIIFNSFHERIGDSDGIVRVLTGHRLIRFRFIMSVVLIEVERCKSLIHKRKYPDDIIHRNTSTNSVFDQNVQLFILVPVTAVINSLIDNCLEKPRADSGARYQRRNLVFLPGFPLYKLFYIGMINIDDNHLGSPPRRAT